jgi:YfiH family protein
VSGTAALVSPALAALGVAHGFGTRTSPWPAAVRRPVQVHGCAVARVDAPGPDGDDPGALGEADAVVAVGPAIAVGVVTADCVPVLVAERSGGRVAAIHAGWRGLAAGVVPAAIAALARDGAPADRLVAAVGPHIGPCCYEVDTPVLDGLRSRFGSRLDACVSGSRPGHARADLGALAREALLAAGIGAGSVTALPRVCTRCDAVRFHSHRRDGADAGRMLHWIATRPTASGGARAGP